MSNTTTDKTLDEINLDQLDSASGGCAACGNPAHIGGAAGAAGGAVGGAAAGGAQPIGRPGLGGPAGQLGGPR